MPEKDIKPPLFPLHVKNLCFKAGSDMLINQLSFSLENKGLTAIMGPNGAGKSLTLRLLHGLLKPLSGEIQWGDETNQKKVADRQAMVFQKPVLLRRTVKENLSYALKIKGGNNNQEREQKIKEALTRANLLAHEKSPARQLSGGEQQKLAMVRAIMHQPDILFLDEATSSLDPNATKAVEDLVLEAKAEGMKIIMVTHDSGQARRLSDEILFLNKGKLAEHGKTTDLLTNPTSKAAKQYLRGEIVTSD